MNCLFASGMQLCCVNCDKVGRPQTNKPVWNAPLGKQQMRSSTKSTIALTVSSRNFKRFLADWTEALVKWLRQAFQALPSGKWLRQKNTNQENEKRMQEKLTRNRYDHKKANNTHDDHQHCNSNRNRNTKRILSRRRTAQAYEVKGAWQIGQRALSCANCSVRSRFGACWSSDCFHSLTKSSPTSALLLCWTHSGCILFFVLHSFAFSSSPSSWRLFDPVRQQCRRIQNEWNGKKPTCNFAMKCKIRHSSWRNRTGIYSTRSVENEELAEKSPRNVRRIIFFSFSLFLGSLFCSR